MPNGQWLEGQTLPQQIDPADELEIREAMWWNLQPGEPGYDQELREYLGFTEQEWLERKMFRGWRR